MRSFLMFVLVAASLGPPAAGAATRTYVGSVELIVDRGAAPAGAAAPAHPKPRTAAARPAAQARAMRPDAPPAGSPVAENLVRDALRFVGVPYVFGGANPGGFDCSGFAQYVYARSGIAIPRTADAQFAAGRLILGDPAPGDLVFFQTYDWGASHVGIYLGNGYFLNAIAPNVHVASFASSYFRGRYLGARRFLPG